MTRDLSLSSAQFLFVSGPWAALGFCCWVAKTCADNVSDVVGRATTIDIRHTDSPEVYATTFSTARTPFRGP